MTIEKSWAEKVQARIDAEVSEAKKNLANPEVRERLRQGINRARFARYYEREPAWYTPTVTPEMAIALIEMVDEK